MSFKDMDSFMRASPFEELPLQWLTKENIREVCISSEKVLLRLSRHFESTKPHWKSSEIAGGNDSWNTDIFGAEGAFSRYRFASKAVRAILIAQSNDIDFKIAIFFIRNISHHFHKTWENFIRFPCQSIQISGISPIRMSRLHAALG